MEYPYRRSPSVFSVGQPLRGSLALVLFSGQGVSLQEKPKCVFGGATTEGLTVTGFVSRSWSIPTGEAQVWFQRGNH
uniref:Uncharacterized protein n=1 Tax=Xenopus tropicalis TaxID=8364 RepID=A0A1B8Y728_XENTR